MSRGTTQLHLGKTDTQGRLEIDDVKLRLKMLEAQEGATPLATDGSVGGATGQAQAFALGVLTQLWDYPLSDVTEGNYFNDNTATYPSGWTQATAPQATASNNPYGYWAINGSSGSPAWKFRKQSGINIEGLAANAYRSFWVGPLIIKESLPTADLNYYFGIYKNSAGSIDENTFVRLNINWLAASSLWQIRAERKDGTTQTNSAYYTLARVPVQPMWLRLVVANTTNKDVLGYFGPVRFANAQMQLMSATLGSGVTWGQAWWQFHMSRGAGPDDRILIGGVDCSGDA